MNEVSQTAKPAIKGSTIPYLMVDGAIKAVELYRKAFAAEVVAVHPPDEKGRTMHAHLYINGGSVMFGDPFPEQGCALQTPAGFNIMLPVEDVDAWHRRAVEAGCESVMPPTDMFWGDRYAQVRDPFGVTWAFDAPKK